jgi:hypothetical protein
MDQFKQASYRMRKLRWQPDFVPRHSAAGQTLFYFEQERGRTTRVTL